MASKRPRKSAIKDARKEREIRSEKLSFQMYGQGHTRSEIIAALRRQRSKKRTRPNVSNSSRTTRSMTKIDSPRQAVLQTAELLSHIISWLPVRTILTRAKRVSKTWKATIEATPGIHSRLWIKPQSDYVASPSKFSGYRRRDSDLPTDLYAPGVPMYSQTISLNMLFLDPQARGFKMLGNDYEMKMYETLDITSGKLATLEWNSSHKRTSVEPDRLSWNKMQLAEPPIAVVQIVFRARKRRQICTTVRDKDGVTCGLVREVVEKMVESISRHVRPGDIDEGRTFIAFIADDVDNMPSRVRRRDAVVPW